MPDTYTVTGAVKLIKDTQTFESGFTKREFVITTDDKYPQDIKLEVVKDKCDILDKLNPGDMLTVSFNVRGNEHNGNYYVNLQAWRIELGQPQPQAETKQASANPLNDALDEDTDIPF